MLTSPVVLASLFALVSTVIAWWAYGVYAASLVRPTAFRTRLIISTVLAWAAVGGSLYTGSNGAALAAAFLGVDPLTQALSMRQVAKKTRARVAAEALDVVETSLPPERHRGSDLARIMITLTLAWGALTLWSHYLRTSTIDVAFQSKEAVPVHIAVWGAPCVRGVKPCPPDAQPDPLAPGQTAHIRLRPDREYMVQFTGAGPGNWYVGGCVTIPAHDAFLLLSPPRSPHYTLLANSCTTSASRRR